MKSKELIETIFKNVDGVFPQDQALTAVGAFMANLAQELKLILPDKSLPSPEKDPDQIRWATTLYYVGVISGFQGEIPEGEIKSAHLSLMFPWTRAILSRGLLGEGLVTRLGVPAGYEA